jgi:predicted nuclease of predicted toxin-antitoxin system
VKLLFDQNLSPKLVRTLADLFPYSAHVDPLGLGTASDDVVWDYCLKHEFTVVTKDEDYSTLSVLRGFPPKILWLTLGNCSTRQIEDLFRKQIDQIRQFELEASGVLILSETT